MSNGDSVSFNKQLTLRGIIIGVIGSAVLTMSSMYVALKLGALPWPIIFAALVSMFFLKLLGNTNVHEINVTHTAMSAGAMTAGGLAFTLPGIYMLNPAANINFLQLSIIVTGGVVLGLIFTALIRKYFVETANLPYAMGIAAAETIMAGDKSGKKAITLFVSIGASGVFTFFRDGIPAFFGKTFIPAALMNQKMLSYGSAAGIWFSPMLISIGYIIGPLAIGVWFLGALISDFGILIGGTKLGFFDASIAAALKSSLGIGLMVGTGIGIIIKGVIPKAKEIFAPMFKKASYSSGFIDLRWAPILIAALALVLTIVCKMGVVASIITILGVWLATAMSAQVVGQSGINPMEIFGIIVLLAAKAVSAIGQTEAFFIAAIAAIACGLVGDVLNDFKAGNILKTNPKAQWLAECVGGLAGVFVSVGVFYVILKAYGPDSFGVGKMFTAPQAGAVAAMVGGIPNVPAFVAGIAAACLLYIFNVPVMTLGLGVYLPFYLSLTAFIGGALSFAVKKAAPSLEKSGKPLVVASGVLGGEAFVGVVIAIIQASAGFSALK
ncbi:MAG: oligopeptide transporter, OPT family [Termitinemataceae bacterium]|nr:MAG: oligopeptide transporter, OPT family [Termitinemataceae bacterium]